MFHYILVPLDGSSLAEQALAVATAISAKAGGAQGRMEALLVDADADRITMDGDAEKRIYINAIAEEASRLLGVSVGGSVVAGDPARMIVDRAERVGADLIVMTTHGRTGLRRALLGSVADGVVRDAGRPVLLVRPVGGQQWRTAQAAGFRRILVPLDGTDEARTVVAPVVDLCRWMHARLILTRVVFPVMEMAFSDGGVPLYGVVDEDATRHIVRQAQDALTELALNIESDHLIKVETSVRVANEIAKALVEEVREAHADLVAMATHSRGASRLLIGSVTDRLLRDTELPLLLLHPQAGALAAVASDALAAHA